MNQKSKASLKTLIFPLSALVCLTLGVLTLKRELELKQYFLVPRVQVSVLSWSPTMSQLTLQSPVDLDLSDFILRQGERAEALFLKEVVLKANVPKTITLKRNFLNKGKNTLTLLITVPIDWKEDFERAEK